MTGILNHRILLHTLEDHGECTVGALRGHLGRDAPRATIAYHLSVLQRLGCVALSSLTDPRQRWSITPRGRQWLEVLESAGLDTMPVQPISHALTVWLMDHPGMHRTPEIERASEIAHLIVGRGHSAVSNALNRLTDKGLVIRTAFGANSAGRPCVCWGIVGTKMRTVAATAPGPEPDPARKVPRDAPPGWWDEHWDEIESDFRRVMTGRRPMLLVTIRREMHTERYPRGLINEAVRRGLISASWTRGQQYYMLVR